MEIFTNTFYFFRCSRKMERATKHQILFHHEVVAFGLYQYKHGSKKEDSASTELWKVSIVLRSLGSKLTGDHCETEERNF